MSTQPKRYIVRFDDRQALDTLPDECVRDCSGPGPSDEAVSFWASQIEFVGLDPELVREYLSGFGAWDREELADDEYNLHRLIWIWACDIKEMREEARFYPERGYDGTERDHLYLMS